MIAARIPFWFRIVLGVNIFVLASLLTSALVAQTNAPEQLPLPQVTSGISNRNTPPLIIYR